MAIGWRRATEKLKPWTTKFINLMIEWGRSCWTARNGMIYGEKRQCYTMERKRLQEEARVYLYGPKEESLAPIENFRATRMNLRNLPNIEIANWIAEQRQMRQKIRKRKSTNIMDDQQFRGRTNNAKRNITTVQQNETNAVNDNSNNAIPAFSSTTTR